MNHFNNIFTPETHNKFSLYRNIKIFNQSQTLNEINSVFDINKEEKSEINITNNKLILDDEDCDMNLLLISFYNKGIYNNLKNKQKNLGL